MQVNVDFFNIEPGSGRTPVQQKANAARKLLFDDKKTEDWGGNTDCGRSVDYPHLGSSVQKRFI